MGVPSRGTCITVCCLQPIEDKSMENMKHVDNDPIDLRDCFGAFSKPEELGEDEYW